MRLFLKLLLILICCLALSTVGPLSVWVLLNTPTWKGVTLAFFGFACLSLLILLCLPFFFGSLLRQNQWRYLTISNSCIIFLLVALNFATAPTGIPPQGSPIQHRYTSEEDFRRFAITNVVPEAEQINLGYLLMTSIDPLLTPEQAEVVSVITLDLYAEMEADSNFRALGSTMGLAYRELIGLPYDLGHYYLYAPQQDLSKPMPAILFLHGSVGNFKAYSYVWSKLAEEEAFVIIAPSYGFGNWDEAGVNAAMRALDDAKGVVDIDDSRIYLAGLSNGGFGAAQTAFKHPDLFQGVIFLSPGMTPSIIDSAEFQNLWRDRPILVVTGALDRRIPMTYIENRVQNLEAGGVDVSTVIYPQEDHFLLFSKPNAVMHDIKVWLTEN